MPISRSQLIESLKRLGVASGDAVMIHASLRAIGKVFGGPDQVHLAVEEAVGAGGTLMMYVSGGEGDDDVGRGIFSPEEEAEILLHQPAFDPHTARANRTFGALAEFFRSYPGTICSEAVCARIAARGDRARELVADQPWTFAFGRGSPFEKLCSWGGKVLLLGSSRDEVSLLHYAEHIADFPDKRVARYQVPWLRDGERVWLPCAEFDTNRAHESWPEDFFAQIVDQFIAGFAGTPACSLGPVGNADCVLIDAARLVAYAVPIMEARARDFRAGR